MHDIAIGGRVCGYFAEVFIAFTNITCLFQQFTRCSSLMGGVCIIYTAAGYFHQGLAQCMAILPHHDDLIVFRQRYHCHPGRKFIYIIRIYNCIFRSNALILSYGKPEIFE